MTRPDPTRACNATTGGKHANRSAAHAFFQGAAGTVRHCPDGYVCMGEDDMEACLQDLPLHASYC